jgi:1-acyl-sn-glycerol-3-phosphate acyltransferase
MIGILKAALESLFRLLFVYECEGVSLVPKEGPALIAANHASYLDPILLSLDVERPIHFMAWDALFRVPVLGPFMRAFGAFPVDIQPGKGHAAYLEARTLVEGGELVGVFPEGKRSHTGWMDPTLREGVARLALETGAPLIPASISGSYRAWPYSRAVPSPSPIRVRFHEPIDPAPFQGLPQKEAVAALLLRVRESVDRSLLPGVKADLRRSVLYSMPAPFPRLFEFLPAFFAAILLFWKTRSRLAMAPPYLYLLYLLLDHYVIPQSRLVKLVRNASSALFLLGLAPTLVSALGLPKLVSQEALAAVLAGSLVPLIYEHGRTALAFIRGLVVATILSGLAYAVFPAPFGPHIALPLFVAAFCWERRTVFWWGLVPLLLAYMANSAFAMGLDARVLPHAIAALLSWILARFVPTRAESPTSEHRSLDGLGLGDEDEPRRDGASPS